MSNPTPESAGPDVFDEADRIIILTPCFDRHSTTDYNESLTLAKQFPLAKFRMADGTVQLLPVVAASIWFSNESHIDRARNSLLYQFEQKHYRFGLFMDADQPFEPDQIASLWRHLINGVRVVCGLVALKSIVPTFVCNTLAGERPDPNTGLMRIKDGGTGCMAFNRNILAEIRERWPALVRGRLAACLGTEDAPKLDSVLRALSELGLSADISFTGNLNTCCAGRTAYAYFASGVTHRDGRGDWLSEDWMLCHRLQLMGIPIYADVSVNLRHLGRQLFPPPPEEIIEAALRVTSGNNPPFNKGLSQAASQVLTALHKDINDQSITVLHATRGRPDKALRARELFIKRAGAPVEYIFGLDSDDKDSILALAKYPHAIVANGGNGIVAAINAAAEKATGRILVMAADDCLPPENWALSVRVAFAGQLHEPRVLATSDGYSNQQLIPHPIMTRAFYQEQGYFFCPEYPHLFCDTELTVRASVAGQIIDARHLVFKHENPMFTGEKPDAMAVERNSPEAWAIGEAIFKRRNTEPPTAP